MRCLIELSGESVALAAAESMVLGRAREEDCGLDSRALLMETSTGAGELAGRLALARSVSRHLFSCDTGELDGLLESVELPGSTFRVRAVRMAGSHMPGAGASLAGKAGKVLSARYRVDLDAPDTVLVILMGERLHVGIQQGEVDRHGSEARKPENRPFNHPISLHPKLARALVNLTGVRMGQTVLDPFCGTGGILLEAGLMGCRVLGGDMDGKMVEGTVMNLDHYGVSRRDIRKEDVSFWSGFHDKADAVATDPPYGRSASTARETIESLYSRAFVACHEVLKDRGKLAIILPGESHLSLARGFDLECMYPVRVHRSLTRHFCVLRKAA